MKLCIHVRPRDDKQGWAVDVFDGRRAWTKTHPREPFERAEAQAGLQTRDPNFTPRERSARLTAEVHGERRRRTVRACLTAASRALLMAYNLGETGGACCASAPRVCAKTTGTALGWSSVSRSWEKCPRS